MKHSSESSDADIMPGQCPGGSQQSSFHTTLLGHPPLPLILTALEFPL